MPLTGETGEREAGLNMKGKEEWQRGEERQRPEDGLSFHPTVAGPLEGANLSHLISRLGVFPTLCKPLLKKYAAS